MEQQRNSNCWYLDRCNENCNSCTIYLQMQYQMENSGLPPYRQKAINLYINDNNEIDRDAYMQLADIRKNIVEFVNDHKNLYLCSKYTGNGKTSWAIKMLHTYFHYTAIGNYGTLKGMYVSVADLLLKLKDFNNPVSNSYKNSLKEVDLVIWDDIALTDISPYDYSQLYSIINDRIFAGKSNIFTSNCTDIKELYKFVGDKLASRIWGTSVIIELKGEDLR